MPPIAAKIITNTAPNKDAWSCDVAMVPTNKPKPVAAKPDEKQLRIKRVNYYQYLTLANLIKVK